MSIAQRGGRAVGVINGGGRSHTGDAVWIVAGAWTDALLAPLGTRIGITNERAQIAFFQRPRHLKHRIYIDTIAASYFSPHSDDLALGGLEGCKPRWAEY